MQESKKYYLVVTDPSEPVFIVLVNKTVDDAGKLFTEVYVNGPYDLSDALDLVPSEEAQPEFVSSFQLATKKGSLELKVKL